jgi:3-hydroxyisobutyrate dehydrogenase-like beta-hydroxyacid dehydrogenase
MGERADLAAVNKLFGNAMIIGVSALMADILTMAQSSGVDPQSAVKLLGLLDLNAMVAGRGGNMAKGNFAASFELARIFHGTTLCEPTGLIFGVRRSVLCVLE